MSAEFITTGAGDAVTASVWSGNAVDSNNRFSLYYWDQDAIAVNGAPTGSFLNQDMTGINIASGFISSGLVTGTTPGLHLIVLVGVVNTTTQILNLDIAVA